MKKLATLVLGALALSVGSAQSNVIKIASVSPLSGPQSGLGTAIQQGAQMAIEDAQARFQQLGFQLQFAPQDDQANPDVGVAVARRIVNDPDLLGIVGHLNSGVAIPASEIYKDTNLTPIRKSHQPHSPKLRQQETPSGVVLHQLEETIAQQHRIEVQDQPLGLAVGAFAQPQPIQAGKHAFDHPLPS